MTLTEAQAAHARAIDEATQQNITTKRAAEQTVTLLRQLADQMRAHPGLAYALRDAEDALDKLRRCGVLLDGINAQEPR